jgi:hypothetical protein
VVLAGVIVFFAAALVRSLAHTRSLPSPPAPRNAPATLSTEQGTPPPLAGESLAGYNVIAAKDLFNPSRSESSATAAAAPAPPPPPKPMLMGVVVDGPQSRAYLKEMTTDRVLSYQIGDTVAGGRLDKITDDMVVIVRPDGPMEVLLRDPSKPKPPPPPPTAATAPPAAGTPPSGGATQPSVVPTRPPAAVAAPPSVAPRPPAAVAAPPAGAAPPATVTVPDNAALGRGRGGGRGR